MKNIKSKSEIEIEKSFMFYGNKYKRFLCQGKRKTEIKCHLKSKCLANYKLRAGNTSKAENFNFLARAVREVNRVRKLPGFLRSTFV